MSNKTLPFRFVLELQTRTGAALRTYEYDVDLPLPAGAEGVVRFALTVEYAGKHHRLPLTLPLDVPEGKQLAVRQVLRVEPRASEEISVQRGADGQSFTAVKTVY